MDFPLCLCLCVGVLCNVLDHLTQCCIFTFGSTLKCICHVGPLGCLRRVGNDVIHSVRSGALREVAHDCEDYVVSHDVNDVFGSLAVTSSETPSTIRPSTLCMLSGSGGNRNRGTRLSIGVRQSASAPFHRGALSLHYRRPCRHRHG